MDRVDLLEMDLTEAMEGDRHSEVLFFPGEVAEERAVKPQAPLVAALGAVQLLRLSFPLRALRREVV